MSGTYTSSLKLDMIDHELRRAFELLQGPRHEGKRYAAVLVLREIAFSMPTFFFQNVGQFFSVIFAAINDSNQLLREAAVNAVRAALVLTAQRETTRQTRSQHDSWYKAIWSKTKNGLEYIDTTNSKRTADLRHGALLVLAELFRASNGEWERRNSNIEDTILCEAGGGLEANGGQGLAGFHGGAEGVTMTPPEKLRGLGAMRQYYRANFGKGHKNRDQVSNGHLKDINISYIPFSWFGTVMVGKEPIVESALCKKLLSEHYDQICHIIIGLTKSPQVKSSCVRNALLILFSQIGGISKEAIRREVPGSDNAVS